MSRTIEAGLPQPANTALLLRRREGAVMRLTLNAPDQLNALSDAMIVTLEREFDAVARDPQIRVVVLAAQGRAFCAGHDLREMQAARAAPDGGRAQFVDLFTRCGRLMQKIPALPQPVIAEVHGAATAAGCQLVASCDMAVAAESARFGVNGVNLGLFCATPMVALTRNIGRKKAFELLTTGALIGAAEAERLGLVNRVVPDAALEAETMALAASVAAKLSGAVRIGKRAFHHQLGMSLAEAYDHTAAVMAENMMWADTEEGIAAFLEKRPPEWRG